RTWKRSSRRRPSASATRRRGPRTGAGIGSSRSGSSSGRAAPTGCTTGCATSAREAPGASGALRPDKRRPGPPDCRGPDPGATLTLVRRRADNRAARPLRDLAQAAVELLARDVVRVHVRRDIGRGQIAQAAVELLARDAARVHVRGELRGADVADAAVRLLARDVIRI